MNNNDKYNLLVEASAFRKGLIPAHADHLSEAAIAASKGTPEQAAFMIYQEIKSLTTGHLSRDKTEEKVISIIHMLKSNKSIEKAEKREILATLTDSIRPGDDRANAALVDAKKALTFWGKFKK